ncbi:metal ABC transporter ATP-binding protein [Clostridium paraputrificum]|uniref:Metal ABC transporter ATP-binding protein n=1 Tax=Clostridium paraputrificum TaxID=29363 RepID=A0A1B8RUJ9_9CLOT|nr:MULTISPECIES: metal ABC transporter ATP-binding protein [Clostridium]MDB2071123.1 metal ABC transporter ATP-binding protein [Clostridium paraputrificum]MDB2080878.1 metal ABC transporter ATP-binding protein [Clostridium paraputrificum]MDB2088776.1 metal ABC transporter ATP-binding protein [Clostridium paraputrificum]MDB2095217.1 metal ABC transporter ATP-binding protein [Clostridium paraputrificum]MDB2101408.1 metal ABC transporter ATP-binding protein [Clostridium paraputrificum]
MIKINNLSFAYNKNTPPLLKNVNLDIPKGVYLSIVGENGSCKTTLIKLILGLLTPISGSITVDTDNIAYVPQRLDGFNSQFPISIYEILKIHAKSLKLDPKSSSIDVLEKVNMLKFKENLIGNLSGGQQQRVFIARALIGNPDLIILDEPSTGVDVKNQQEIYSLLSKINKEQGTTIISIEHNMDIALKYSTHILTINNGKLTLQSNKDFRENYTLPGA